MAGERPDELLEVMAAHESPETSGPDPEVESIVSGPVRERAESERGQHEPQMSLEEVRRRGYPSDDRLGS